MIEIWDNASIGKKEIDVLKEMNCRYLQKEGDKTKTMDSSIDIEENMDTNTSIDTH